MPSKGAQRFLSMLLSLLFIVSLLPASALAEGAPGTGPIVIYHLYGGGGNSGATYKNDFVVLKNIGSASVDISGYTLWYSSAKGTAFSVQNSLTIGGVDASLAPGAYCFIQLAAGTGGDPYPPIKTDILQRSGSIAVSATTGKFALTSDTTMPTLGAAAADIISNSLVDFVGFGTDATHYLGTGYAPTLNNSTAILRTAYTGGNSADYTAQAVNAANLAYLFAPAAETKCVTPTASPASGTVDIGSAITLSTGTAGASIYYTTDGSTPTSASTLYSDAAKITAAGTAEATFVVKAIAVKVGLTDSDIATFSYTLHDLTSDPITIAAARSASGTVKTKGVITFVEYGSNYANIALQDSTGGIVARFTSLPADTTPFTVGKELTVTGTRGAYNGLEQITLAYTDNANFAIGATTALPAPQTVTLAQLTGTGGEAYESERIKIVGATLGTINTGGNTPITQGADSLNIYKIPTITGLETGSLVTVVGVLSQFTSYQLRVVNASDITLYTAIPDPITGIPDGAVDINSVLGSGTSGTVTVVGQLVYRFGNYGTPNTAILEDVIDGEIVALQIYNALSSFQLGDVIKVTGTKADYGGVTQLTSPTATLVEHPAVMIPAQEFETIAELLAKKADLVSEWVLLKNVKLGTYVSNGSTDVIDPNNAASKVPIYRAATYPTGVLAGEIINLYACVSKYSATDQLRVGSSTDYVVTNDTNPPVITLYDSYLDAEVSKDYIFKVKITDNVSVVDPKLTYAIGTESGVTMDLVKNATTGDYEAVIPASAIVATASEINITITATDPRGNVATPVLKTIPIKNEPQVISVTPLANTATGDVKTPLISVTFGNGMAGTTAKLTLNGGAEIDMTVSENPGGTYIASYTPVIGLADEKYTAVVVITRPDLKTATYTWVFTVGEAQYTAYFGQLHSHTAQYSDGAGTLNDGLNYIKNISDADNVQFVAFTDHSNYFDTTSAANPASALNDKNLMTPASLATWNAYTSAMRSFNTETGNVNNIVAVPGFEMTWSGGPGHINTFNSDGLVSRNNTVLNNKTADAGMKAYYDTLIANPEPLANLSQFNHPGTTFGTFSDFAYYSPAYNSKMVAVEVGNGEGAIGAGGYYPSYAEYTKALDKGWHVAPTNNQDNHKGHWGNGNTARTVILTDDLSETGLLRGLKDLSVYSTEDKNLDISYTLNEQIMGSIISTVPTEPLRFAVNVNDPDGSDVISKIEVVTSSGRIAESKNFSSNSAVWNFELPVAEGYYYLRVTQADLNIAVTAPVWIGQAPLVGINSLESSTKLPVTGEELTFTTKLFNGESTEATLKSITYKQGETVLKAETPNTAIPAYGTQMHTFAHTFNTVGKVTITVVAIIESKGAETEYSQNIGLTVYDANKLVYIGIDASHYNEYVDGNYKDSMVNFAAMAVEYGVRVVELKTSEALIAATANPQYKMLVLTPPTRRNGSNFLIGYKSYNDAEIAAVASFAQAGNTVIVTCWGDYYENYTKYSDDTPHTLPPEAHMAATQNKLLKAIGASLRVSDDEIKNDRENGGQPQRLYLKDYNIENPFLARVDADEQVYSNYGGSTIYAVDETDAAATTLPTAVSPMVYAFSDSYSSDDDHDNYAGITIPKYDGKYMVLASETVEHANGNSSTVIVAGSAFMSNFEIQAEAPDSYATPAYSNFTILENVVQSINPTVITPIADVQAEPKEGESFVIRGIVTSNASGYDKDTAFFDCIYVQDTTGGINAFPVSGNICAGQTVEIRGTTSSYEGERQIAVERITIIDANISPLPAPVILTTAQAAASNCLGSLVKVSGTVTRIISSGDVVESIFVKDASGVECRVFINGYITKNKTISNLKVGSALTAIGLSSIDPEGARIRIRDRADVTATVTPTPPPGGGVTVPDMRIITVPTTIPSPEKITAMPSANAFTQPVDVAITESDSAGKAVFKALAKTFFDGSMKKAEAYTIFPLDISVYLRGTNTKVQPQSGAGVTFTIPIPSSLLADKDKIIVGYVADDGKLILLPVDVVTVDGVSCIRFTASHFSVYALILDPASKLASSVRVPNTGSEESACGLLLLGAALLCLGAALVLKRRRRASREKES